MKRVDGDDDASVVLFRESGDGEGDSGGWMVDARMLCLYLDHKNILENTAGEAESLAQMAVMADLLYIEEY